MAKSRSLLINAIRQHPESIDQPNVLGQTALHLSVYWLEGMQDLLEAGADIDAIDQEGLTPIFYAAGLLLHEPLSFLAGKKCVLYKSNIWSLGATSRMSLLEWVLVLWRFDKEDESVVILDTIIRLVVERRRELEVLARASLDARAVEGLLLSTEGVLDRNASLAVSMLRSKKIDVPACLTHLTREHSTIYHVYTLTLGQVQRLWDAGFREIDELDMLGLSPLMANGELFGNTSRKCWEVATWLVEKGANLHRRQERVFQQRYENGYKRSYLSTKASSTTALHYLGAISGTELGESYRARTDYGWLVSRLQAVSWQGRRLRLDVLSEPLPDSCNCACSAMGCTAYTMMAKCLVTTSRSVLGGSIASAQEELLIVSQAFAQVVSVERPSLARLRVETIRFNTFEKLDLRHTCCDMTCDHDADAFIIHQRHGDEEIHKIQEEQAEQMEKLETLLEEFKNKSEESGSTFNDFMNGYWSDRMSEVLAEEGPVDREALEDMGIVLRKEDISSPLPLRGQGEYQLADLPFMKWKRVEL